MSRRPATLAVLIAAAALAAPARADGPADNVPNSVRRVPKLGVEVPEDDRNELAKGLAVLKAALTSLEQSRDPKVKELLPDVQIYDKAVRDALKYREFFETREIARAKVLLETGLKRADQLSAGKAPWTAQTGLIVRGYLSKIDGSVQPYGLVVPDSYSAQGPRVRLDLWFHGRGETLSELNFIDQREHNRGDYTPPDTIVLHPYGRYCNAFKFAGEVDVLEALDAVKKAYRIDDDRISVRGFSMGGAACWQFAVHYADRWFAANPGAGFAETARFLNAFQKEDVQPPAYEKKLWHLYDCPDYAENLFQCPTIAYSGDQDIQKQAADVMAEALDEEGINLLHVIGPGTKHSIHPDSKREIEARLASLATQGRIRHHEAVSLVTYTLKYNRMNWVTIDALGEHWKKARVFAEFDGGPELEVTTENVDALTLDVPAGEYLYDLTVPVDLIVDGVGIEGPKPFSDRSWRCPLHREKGEWKLGPLTDSPRKRHDLQGPIDDAFMDSFLMVRPTGKAAHELFQKWSDPERDRAVEHWRRHFRGEARVKDDSAVSDADIAASNLVLWGDPESNAVLKRIAEKLPISWTRERIKVGDRLFPSENHALILICPNPLNPKRYVVLNSGFTFRDYDYLNNARQVPKLPDWAVVDLRTPPDSRSPGKVVAADFFDEAWGVKKAEPPKSVTDSR